MLLENKVVIIAGLGGIGNGLARRYADEGALLAIGDLDAELASQVAFDIDPSGARVSYQMSKAAELALMRHIARRYGPQGIRANAIAPGLIWHYKFDQQPMLDGIIEQTRARQMIKSRFGKPNDVAAIGALLLSDDGSFITGQTISVDGGVTFRP
jgi:NAD(P)-dependent dehydrogenase (short-subunit alcohol dehydrogenase family)